MTAASTETRAQAARLKAIIAGIDDVGLVHGWPRYGNAHDKWVTTIAGQPTIRAWEVGLEDPGIQVTAASAGGYRHRIRTWGIRGYLALLDENPATGTEDDLNGSYLTAVDLAGDIADAIDADRTLAGSCLQHDTVQTRPPGPVSVPVGDGFLCWGITMTVDAWSLTP